MAKIITIEFTDAEFASLQKAYSAADADATGTIIKNAFINLVKYDMKNYDKREARDNITYTPLNPK